jgi:hypothetical protein
VYLGDVISVGRIFQEPFDNVRKMFQRFRGTRLKLKPEKCQMPGGGRTVPGTCITGKSNYRHTEAEGCTGDKHELISFLGLRTCNRRFISGFADIAKPLT